MLFYLLVFSFISNNLFPSLNEPFDNDMALTTNVSTPKYTSNSSKAQRNNLLNRNNSPVLDNDQLLGDDQPSKSHIKQHLLDDDDQASIRPHEQQLKESRKSKVKTPPKINFLETYGPPIPPPFAAPILQTELLDTNEEKKMSELLDIIDNLQDWDSDFPLDRKSFILGGIDLTDPDDFKEYLQKSSYIVTRDNLNSINGLLSFNDDPNEKDAIYIRLYCYKQNKIFLDSLHDKIEEHAREQKKKAIVVTPHPSQKFFYKLRGYKENGKYGILIKNL